MYKPAPNSHWVQNKPFSMPTHWELLNVMSQLLLWACPEFLKQCYCSYMFCMESEMVKLLYNYGLFVSHTSQAGWHVMYLQIRQFPQNFWLLTAKTYILVPTMFRHVNYISKTSKYCHKITWTWQKFTYVTGLLVGWKTIIIVQY